MTMTANSGNSRRRQQRIRPSGCRGIKKSQRGAAPGLAGEKFPLVQAKASTPIAPHLTAFFEQRLPIERHASENTSNSYAYAFQLLLTFASKRLQVAPSQLAVEQINAPLVLDFLNDLETTRGNGPSSRNIRLAAIKSFLHFLEYRVPSALEQIRRILAIPTKKTVSKLVRHLTAEETQALLDAPDPTGWKGPQGTVPAAVEDNYCDAPSLVGGEGKRTGARTLRQCTRRIVDSLRLRIHPAQARPNCEAALRLAGHEARAPTRPEAHLRFNCSAGDQRSAKGLAVAWSRADTNYGNVHASGSIGETGSPGIGGASETALRALQGYRQADRIAKGGDFYAEEKAFKMTYWLGLSESDSA